MVVALVALTVRVMGAHIEIFLDKQVSTQSETGPAQQAAAKKKSAETQGSASKEVEAQKHATGEEDLAANPSPALILPKALNTMMPTASASPQMSATPNETANESEGPDVKITIHRDPADQNSHMLGGVKTKSKNQSGNTGVTISPSPSPTTEADTGTKRVGGQARGFTMIALMHPKARQSTEAAVDVLLRAEIEEPYLAVLVDGSFSIDFDYLDSIIRRLNTEGRRLTLQMYFSNGPSQRKFETTPITAAFNLIDPFIFREIIHYDQRIQNQFREIVARAKNSYALNLALSPGSSNLAVMMLEDNLEVKSYTAMRKLAEDILGNSVDYVRNPCPSCYEGNDTATLGDGFEAHDPALITLLRPTDGYSLDGFGYLYPGEPGDQLPYDHVMRMMQNSLNSGVRYFGLWRAGKQGLGPQGQIHPDEREYEVPNQAEREFEIELLRSGLLPIEPVTTN